MMKNNLHTEVNTETLNKLLKLSEAILKGDYSMRVVSDFNDDVINQIVSNLNKHVDELMLNSSERSRIEKININNFIETISSFANRDFTYKLPVSEHGTILDAIATGINILGDELEQSTASKHELEIERNLLNEAQALAKVGSWEFNTVSGELTGSREFYRLFEMEDTAPAERYAVYRGKYHPEDLVKVDEVFLKMENTDEEGFNFEHRIISKNGGIKYFSCIGEIIRDEKSTTVKGTVQDITDRKTAEIELSSSFEIVTEQNKRLLNFSYIVSHNLRSHASNITSLLKLIQAADSDEERIEIMQHMQIVSNLLNETMVNLHDIVSIQKNINLIVEPLNLRNYVNEAIAILSKQIEAKQAIIKNNIPDNTVVNYNPAYLESIVLNFLSNSIKYSHPRRQPLVFIDFEESGDRQILTFADNGIGIDLQKNGDKLFGMYKTFHGNKDARGIGLFISKNQIETMGGKVDVESEPEKGSTFKIYLR